MAKLYNENPNYKIQQLFIDSLVVIDTLKALSNIIGASFTEDEYGIVQTTLPDILTTFIELQKVNEIQYLNLAFIFINFFQIRLWRHSAHHKHRFHSKCYRDKMLARLICLHRNLFSR